MNFNSKQTTLKNVNLNTYQQNKLKQTNIKTLYNQENDLDYSTQYQVPSKYNHNGNSDLDTIYINELSTITNEIQNSFTNDQDYLIYCKYLEGKTLKEIINSDYKASYLTDDSDHNQIQKIMDENNIDGDAFTFIMRIDEALTKFNKSNDLKNFSKLSDDMMNAEFVEICHTDSGYDASVLKDINGNYMIVNSCTNASSLKDILAISYPICRYLTGSDDFIQIVFDYLVNNADLTNVSEEYFSISESFDNNKNLYEEQINDNLKLVEKYCDKAKNDNTKVDLYAYSLGGGTQETTYASLKDSNSDKLQYIQSISVYNPFTLYAQEYKDNYIDLLANDDKLCIYSAEQDYVSTFNDSVGDLLDKTVFLKADDIESNSVNGISDVGGLIIGSNSNHGFAPLDKSAFDENGNINETGEFISINSSIANATLGKKSDSENKYKPNYQDIFNDILEPIFLKKRVDIFNSHEVINPNNYVNLINIMNDIEDLKIEQKVIENLVNYFGNNFGQIKYEDITLILSTGLSDIVSREVYKFARPDDINSGLGTIAQLAFDENDFADSVNEILNSKNGKALVLDALSCLLNGDITAYNKQIDRLVDSMIYIFGHKGSIPSQIRNGLFTEKLKSKFKSILKQDEPEIKNTVTYTENSSNTNNTPATTTTATTSATATTVTTSTTTTSTTTTTTTTATTTTPQTTTTAATTTVITGGISPSNLPPQIAYDPIVVEILGYPKGGSYTTSTTVTTTTTAAK